MHRSDVGLTIGSDGGQVHNGSETLVFGNEFCKIHW
jgi:hypothetical protein